jgi:UDP-N-acetylglucosamine--N-acetylmuramyl-(pentapeptide) pyrophosphoryl-undecaprenol N-acetylglucosamine transferase
VRTDNLEKKALPYEPQTGPRKQCAMTWLFATGGSGGHIFPALALAKEAKARGIDVSFLGHHDGMEAKLIPQAGFTFYGVAAGKLDRQKPNPLQGLKAIQGMRQALANLRQLKPNLVVGFGGFASFPGIAAARLLGLPYVLHEMNAHPGLVTRWFARGARHMIVAQPNVLNFLPSTPHTLIGFPVREETLDKEQARETLGLSSGLVTLVMGGSQGSLKLNQVVPKAFRTLKTPTVVLHSSGPHWEESLKVETRDLSNYMVKGFVDAVAAWSVADIAITRAGFGTLSEAAFHQVPLIMVPLPTSAEDHQRLNAKAFAYHGAGWMVEEADLESLGQVWEQALNHREQAAKAAKALSPQGAARSTVNLLESLTPSTLEFQRYQP